MKVTLNWLKSHVDFDFTAEELSHRLTMTGLEVDNMEVLGEGLDDVIVARLNDVKPHPDADRLTICEVDTGSDSVQVVCGAQNHKAGDLVALAQVGTVLPGKIKIKKSKIRNQESRGMLCSTKELGLGDEADGIMILPSDLTLGQPAFEALGIKDVVFEIGLTPNRPDCLSVVGVAREVAAMVGSTMHLPKHTLVEIDGQISERTSVSIEDEDLCPRYAARLIENVNIGPSPNWLVRRLEAVGVRSINNVVDVTNFVMIELGQPLHAFDFDLLNEGRIVVRRASNGDKFNTLDGQERNLLADDLVICDGNGPVAIAGIMGGQNSEVQTETRNIFLESAYFNPIAIRRTSKRLGLHTESSHRFERGADVDMVPLALDRAAALIAELANGEIVRGVIDEYPNKIVKSPIQITASKASSVLGLEVSIDQISKTLSSIGLNGVPDNDDTLTVEVPNFRPDLERSIDLIEEVARLIGYDHIPTTMPVSNLTCQQLPLHLSLERTVRNQMVQLGFSEVINYSFYNTDCLDKLRLEEQDSRRFNIKILNPLNEEQSAMRTTLIPSLLETANRNLSYRYEDLALFELRPIFLPDNSSDLPKERLHLTALLCGRREPLGWAQSNERCNFFDMKGAVEQLLNFLKIDDLEWKRVHDEPYYHPGKSCAIYQNDQLLGTLGELHPEIIYNFDLAQATILCDLDIEAVYNLGQKKTRFSPLSRYPDVQRDSAFLIDEEISCQEIFAVLKRIKIKDLENIVLFDVYSGKGIPQGKKSLAIRATYRALDRTMTDELIQNLHGKLIKALEKEFGAELR